MLFESETFRGISDVSDILVKILDSLPGANSTSEQIKEFESLVKVELQTDQVPPELPPILRKFGWNGVRFTAQDEGEKIRFDIDSLRAELSLSPIQPHFNQSLDHPLAHRLAQQGECLGQ